MGKHVVVITGSPRKNGNSNTMAEAFIKACTAKGHTVTRLDTPFMKLSGCNACDACFSAGEPCVIDDDFNAAAPAIEKADAVIFAMPVYWYSLPAQIKAFIDRLYAFMVGKKDINGKQYGLIACCEENSDAVFEGIRVCLRNSAALLKWKSIGEVCVPGVLNAGDIASTDGCARAAAMADAI